MCCTNEIYKTYQTGFSFCHLGHAPGVGLGALGVPRGVNFFFKHGHVAYQIDRDEEQNKMQVKFSSYGQTGDHGVRSKGQISLNFGYHVYLNFSYQTLRVFSHLKDRKHIEQNFHSSFCCRDHAPRGGTWRCWGSKTLAWGFAMAPHRLHVLVLFFNSYSKPCSSVSRIENHS